MAAKTTRFVQTTAATSGAYAGSYLWSNAANWTNGTPVSGDSVTATVAGIDDLGTMTIATLTLSGNGQENVVAGTVTIGSLVVSGGGVASLGNAISAATRVVLELDQRHQRVFFGAIGSRAFLTDLSVSRPTLSHTYVQNGGYAELSAAPDASSTLQFLGVGEIVLDDPNAVTPGLLAGLGMHDVLELPGTKVTSVAFGAAALTVTTDFGPFAFTDVGYAGIPTGFTAAHDPTTGLEAITFTGTTTFQQVAAATSGLYSGQYLWSNPKNWTNGVPMNGDTVATVKTGIDDIANLQLAAVTNGDPGGSVVLTANAVLTVGADTGTSIETSSIADVSSPSTITIGSVSGTGLSFGALSAGSAVFVNLPTDPGLIYFADNGGTVTVAPAPIATSMVYFGNGAGKAILPHMLPGSSVKLPYLNANDVIELPGTMVVHVAIGVSGVVVTTDAGAFSFTNLSSLAGTPTRSSAATDPATGLLAITFLGVDYAQPAVASAGQYLWSNVGNWSNGLPVTGDDVALVFTGAPTTSFTDGIPSLHIASLNEPSGVTLTVAGAVLNVDSLTVTGPTQLLASAGVGQTAAVTIGSVAGHPALIANGTGASVTDLAATDPGGIYTTQNGGLLTLAATPAAGSSLQVGQGTIALRHPGPSVQAALGIDLHSVIEVPGNAVSSVTIGVSSIGIVTDAGSVSFGHVSAGAVAPTGYVASHDAATGLEAIAFTGTDSFVAAVAATSGPWIGQYLWSNPQNWNSGLVPQNGDSVIAGGLSQDDIPRLALASLALAPNTQFQAVDAGLVVGTLTAGTGAELVAFSVALPTLVAIGRIASPGGTFLAAGSQASLVDFGSTDPAATFIVQSGGTIQLAAPPIAATQLRYNGPGTIALLHPGTQDSLVVNNPGDVLEVPGTSVASLAVGAAGLTVATDQGSTSFAGATAGHGVTGATVTHDSASGLLSLALTDQARAGDFNGDGTADQLWQASTGALLDYSMTNGAITGGAVVGALDPSYRFLAAGDFNGDGTADQLWQAANGQIVDYSMSKGAISAGAVVGALDPSYKFLAAADFNGDGTTDQLWQASTGAIVDYTMQAGTIASGAVVGALDPTYKFLAAADLDGDGTADQLWQASNGVVIDYAMLHGSITQASVVGTFDSSMKFIAAADFNGDGRADLLWQGSGGTLIDDTMNGPAIVSSVVVGALDPSFRFLAAGDFNGDGTADQLWQTGAGGILDFTMQGGTVTGGVLVGALDASFRFLCA